MPHERGVGYFMLWRLQSSTAQCREPRRLQCVHDPTRDRSGVVVFVAYASGIAFCESLDVDVHLACLVTGNSFVEAHEQKAKPWQPESSFLATRPDSQNSLGSQQQDVLVPSECSRRRKKE